jgi:uridine kinase
LGRDVTKTHFVGIAGGSCSGKTTLATELAARLGAQQTSHLAIDSYYYGVSPGDRVDTANYNFDEPSSLDHKLLIKHLHGLSRGRGIDCPVYDFKTHSRTEHTSRIEPRAFLILEGLFPLYWEDVRIFLDTKVFIDVSHDTCLVRRLNRDARERGRPKEEVIRRYNDMTRPMFEKYVRPTRRFADVIADGEKPAEVLAAEVVRHIEGMSG